MKLTSLLKIFGWLLLTSSLCMAGSNANDSHDPNMSQFFEQDKKQTQGEYCARCVENAMSPLSVYGLGDVRAALKKTDSAHRQTMESSVSLKEESASKTDVNLYTSSFDQETARLLAEKIKTNSATPISTIKIFYRQEIASSRQIMLQQIRKALKNQFSSQDSSAQGSSGSSAGAEDSSLIKVGDYVNFNGQKIRIEMYSFSDQRSNAKMQWIAGDGKPKLESSYYYSLDPQSQINVSSSLAGSKRNSIMIQFVQAWE